MNRFQFILYKTYFGTGHPLNEVMHQCTFYSLEEDNEMVYDEYRVIMDKIFDSVSWSHAQLFQVGDY